MIAGQNGDRNGAARPLWITGLSPPDSWRSLRQPGYPQLHRARHPQHRVWGYDRKSGVSDFRLSKVCSFRLPLTRASVLPGCDDCDRQCGRPALRSLAQQPGRELAPAVPTTGRGNGQVQGRKDPAEICFCPCLDPQPLTWGIVSQGKDQFALRMVFLRGYGIQVRAPFDDTALRRAGQTHIWSPVAPAAPTSRFRRWRLRRTGPLFNTAISAKWLSGPPTWIRRG